MKRRPYKSKSRKNSIIREAATTANRLTWWKCLALGAAGFVIFYCLLPIFMENEIQANSNNQLLSVVQQGVGRLIRGVKLTGLTIALISIFFAVRDYYGQQRMQPMGVGIAARLARLVARFIN